MASKQQQAAYDVCSSLPVLFNGWGYTHSLYCLLGRGAHTVSVRERWLWALRYAYGRSDPAWRFFEDAQARVSQGSGPAAAEAQRRLRSWGSQNGSVSEGRDGHRLISAFTWRVQCFVSGLGSTRCGFIRPDRSTYTAAIWFWGIKCCQCKRYWGFATSVSCLWWAGWGFDESGWEIM